MASSRNQIFTFCLTTVLTNHPASHIVDRRHSFKVPDHLCGESDEHANRQVAPETGRVGVHDFGEARVDEDGGEEEEGREAQNVGVEFLLRRNALFHAHAFDSYDEVFGALRVILSLSKKIGLGCLNSPPEAARTWDHAITKDKLLLKDSAYRDRQNSFSKVACISAWCCLGDA